jgi:hypothetical protein
VTAKDAATMFLSLIQGLGFQFAIARLPVKLSTEAERVLALYLQAIMSSTNAAEQRALGIIETAKGRQKARQSGGALVSYRRSEPHDRERKISQSANSLRGNGGGRRYQS